MVMDLSRLTGKHKTKEHVQEQEHGFCVYYTVKQQSRPEVAKRVDVYNGLLP